MSDVRVAALRSEALAFIDRLEADEDLNPRVLAFREAVFQVLAMHDRKQADYGKEGDPFANIRSSEEWGIPPWVGALMRMNDKMKRLQRFAQRGSLANESAEDSLLDMPVYGIIALVLYREASEAHDAVTAAAVSGDVEVLPYPQSPEQFDADQARVRLPKPLCSRCNKPVAHTSLHVVYTADGIEWTCDKLGRPCVAVIDDYLPLGVGVTDHMQRQTVLCTLKAGHQRPHEGIALGGEAVQWNLSGGTWVQP